MHDRPRLRGIPGGFGAGAGAAVFMMLVMGLLRLISNTISVPELMEERLIQLSGGEVNSFFINTLGTGGKALLLVFVLEGTLLLGALLGLLFARVWPARVEVRRWRFLSGLLYGLLVGLALNALFLPLFGHGFFGMSALEATAPPDIAQAIYGESLAPWGLPAWLNMMVLGLVFGLVLVRLLPWERADESRLMLAARVEADERRRGLLRAMGGGLLALVGGAALWGVFARIFQAPPSSALVEDGGLSRSPGTTNGNAPSAADLSRDDAGALRPTPEPGPANFEEVKPLLVPEITPTDTFYITTKNFVDPTVSAATWKLTFKGLVENPYSLTLDEIKAMPSELRTHTLACISNPVGGGLIGNARWKGVSFAELLKRAGPKPGAIDVVVRGADGYSDSFTLDVGLQNRCLLAYEMNGEPLNQKHGYPLRLLVPGIFGMKNCKWITEVELVSYDFLGYWQNQGWSDPAPYLTMSRIDYPERANIEAGPVYIGGIAFAGDQGIKRVEVSTDDGSTWQEAQVRPPLGNHTWVHWTYPWRPEPGTYTLKVRATDGKGETQAAREQGTYPDGATGYHTRRVRVDPPRE